MSLLESEQIPVLMFDGTSLRVRPASEGPYLAISHVWADGLGSVTERGLPVCQVRRIAAYASRLVPSGAFWMDSLCVPERKDLRKQAIVLMARTYEGSQSVLVLDSVISACPVSLPQKERMVRLQTSGWMQRIWTLQEAMLARQLVFLVSDELIEAQAFLHPPPTPTALSSGARSCYVPIDAPDGLLWGGSGHFLMFPAELRTSRNFPLVLHFLENRVTSKPEDETLALSGLLKLDTAKLLSVSTAEERMRIFLLLVRVLPTNIIFYLGPRLPMPGFRWAPRTLTSASGGVDAMNAFCTEEGLEGDYTVVHFSGEDLNIERTPVGDVMWFVHREKPDERGHLYTAGIITDTWHPNDPTPAVRINAIVLQTSHLLRETGKRFIAAGVFAPPLQQDGWEERMASGTRLACEYVAPLGMWKQNDGHPHKGPCCTLIETPILLT